MRPFSPFIVVTAVGKYGSKRHGVRMEKRKIDSKMGVDTWTTQR